MPGARHFIQCFVQVQSRKTGERPDMTENVTHEHKRASARDFQQCGMCDQQSLRSASAYAQSDQSLC